MSDHIEHACHKCGSLICSGRCSQDLIGRAYAAYHGPDVEKIDKLKDVVVEAAEKYLYESQLHPCPDLTLRRVYLDNLRKALSKLRERQLTVVEPDLNEGAQRKIAIKGESHYRLHPAALRQSQCRV